MGRDITIFGVGSAMTPGMKAEYEILARAKRLGEKAMGGPAADGILADHRKLCKSHAEISPLDVEDSAQLQMLRERLKVAKFSLADMEHRFAGEEPNDVFTVAKSVRAKALAEAQDRVASLVRQIRRVEASHAVEDEVEG